MTRSGGGETTGQPLHSMATIEDSASHPDLVADHRIERRYAMIVAGFDVHAEGNMQRVVCQRCRTSWLRDTDDDVRELVARHAEEAKVALLG